MIGLILGSQLRRNMVSGVVATIVNTAVMLVSYPLCLSYLGYEKYGVWLILTTVLTFVQMGGNLGIESAVTKLVAEEYGRRNIRGIESYLLMAMVILSTSGTVGFFIILFFKFQIVSLFNLTGDNAVLALHLLPYIGLLCIYMFNISALNTTLSGLGRMDLTNYVQLTGGIIFLCVTVLLLRAGLGVESLLIASAVLYLVIHILSIVLIRRILGMRILRVNNWNWQRLKKLLRFGTGMVGSSFLNMLISPFNKFILSNRVGVASIPIYELAYRGSMQARSLIEVGFRALMPEVSKLGAEMGEGASNRILNIYRRSMRLVLLGGVPLLITTMFVINYTPLFKIWLGSKFVDEMPKAFCIMLLGAVLGLIGVPAYHTLIGLSRVRHIVISHIIQSGMNVALVTGIVLSGLSLTITHVVWMTAISMGGSTVYLIWQKYRVMTSIQPRNFRSGL